MKAVQIPVTSGPVAGTMVTRVESNSGKLLGFIRVVNCDWTPTLGGSTEFLVHQCNEHLGYKVKCASCLADAYKFLGVSIKELDNSYLGDFPYDEKSDNYWRWQHLLDKADDYASREC